MLSIVGYMFVALTFFSQGSFEQFFLQRPGAENSIFQAKGENVKVRLLDAFSGEAIKNSEVLVQSDNGIRCVKPPCPTNHRSWIGTTDDQGYVLVPKKMVQQVTRINTPTHKDGSDLSQHAEKDPTGAWVAELLPNDLLDGPNLGSRAIKLIDANTNRALANKPAKISFDGIETLELKTNSLGYIFIPVEKAEENTWVTVLGYKRGKIDFAAVRYKTKLEPEQR